jgi:predicted NBD/HSP70 family sugar kinase
LKNRVIAIDIGGTKTIVALIDSDLEILDSYEFKSSNKIDELISMINSKADKLDPEKKLDVGVAICGLLSLNGGRLLLAPNMGWKDLDLKEIFSGIGRKIYFVNDGTAAAWASYNTEKKYNVKRLLAITLGTGVGGGVVIDEGLLIGAGELGHIKICFDGPKCNCGKKGCLEAYVGGKHIPKRVKEWFGLEIETVKDLQVMANGGNDQAVECWKKIGNTLGYALSGVVNLNGIQQITVGGKIARASDYFLPAVQAALEDNLMSPEYQHCQVSISKWEHNFSLIGAALLILNPPRNYFKN